VCHVTDRSWGQLDVEKARKASEIFQQVYGPTVQYVEIKYFSLSLSTTSDSSLFALHGADDCHVRHAEIAVLLRVSVYVGLRLRPALTPRHHSDLRLVTPVIRHPASLGTGARTRKRPSLSESAVPYIDRQHVLVCTVQGLTSNGRSLGRSITRRATSSISQTGSTWRIKIVR